MQLISVAFRLAMYEFWGLESELLVMLEAVIRYSSIFPGKKLKVTDFMAFLESGDFTWLPQWSRAAGNFLVAH
jgi:hypothetical protein